MEYVYLMHVVQERKKFDFVETLWSFMHSWSNYYRFGHERTQVSAPYMNDLKVYGPDHVQLTKVNWRLKVNWKNFQEIFCNDFPIHFVVVNHVL